MGRAMRIVSAFFMMVLVAMTSRALATTLSSEDTLVKENLKTGRALLSQYRRYYSGDRMVFKSNPVVATEDHISENNKGNSAKHSNVTDDKVAIAFRDCSVLYDQGEELLNKLLALDGDRRKNIEDGWMWLSGVFTSHMTCLDGLKEIGWFANKEFSSEVEARANLMSVLTNSLAFYARRAKPPSQGNQMEDAESSLTQKDQYSGILKSWNPSSSNTDIVVARDGSGDYKTIRDAVSALSGYKGGGRRVIVYIKAGTYKEQVVIRKGSNNVMFVGDGIGKTVVTGSRNYVDGYTTISSATFAVFGDGFWARDMTFENTAGPSKHQAVALMVTSDHSLFFRCSFIAYQDTLYAHSLRQFYRDCQIHGTIDFIFGNAAAVFQNCDIIVRKPMGHQSNMVTAQGRDDPNLSTGFSIHGSRILPSQELGPVKGTFRTFLGRPWKRYARVVVWRTEMDGMIDPRGWTEWEGGYGLRTLFYAEYMNSGDGADTSRRVNWPGFHVLKSRGDVSPFNVRNFIQGEAWVSGSGVPVWLED